MAAPRLTDDAERRVRLVARHHLMRTAPDCVTAVRGIVALHSSDPATPYLALWARVPGFTTALLEHALYEARSLWRLHAMRRTLFVVPSEEAPIFAAGSRAVAVAQRKQLAKWLAAEMDPGDVPHWLARVEAKTRALLADGIDRRTQDVSKLVPELALELTVGSGKYTQRSPLSSRLLYLLAMEGHIARAQPIGTWRSSQYHWLDSCAFGSARAILEDETGRLELARRYLATHGPVTLADLRWWTGWTARQATAALAGLSAVAVAVAAGEGWVLPADVDAAPALVPGVALLPSLDPTAMGWTQRDWYLGPHRAPLYDRNGNIGPTVWVDTHRRRLGAAHRRHGRHATPGRRRQRGNNCDRGTSVGAHDMARHHRGDHALPDPARA